MRASYFQRVALSSLVVLMAVAPAAFAQLTGDLQVNVSDISNAGIPNASIMVKNLDTGATRTANTDVIGEVSVNQLAVGNYEITVAHEGFATTKVQGTVVGGTSNTVSVTVNVATAAQEIVVTARAEIINTVNGQLQQTTERSSIADLPTVTSGVLQLATTSPGVAPVTPNNPFLGLGSYNSNGGRGRSNNITIDGATATDISTTGGAGLGTVPLDAIREVNFITNQFNAEFGRNASSQFQILTLSGSNDFHGELFEFFRNSFLNTRDYFDRTGFAVPNINNDWGAMAGGKIRANKLFYFGSYEENTIRGLGGTRIATVPTPAQVAGAVPFAQQIIKDYNVPTSPTGTVTQVAPNTTDFLGWSGRVDWIVTKNDNFFGRFGESANHANSTGNTFIDSNLVLNGASSFNRSWTGTLNETHTFSPNTVNNFMAAYGRSAPVFTPFVNNSGKPEIIFNDGTANFGTWSGLPQGRIQNTFQYQDIVTHVRGRHTIKLGIEVDRVQANSFFDSNVNGSLTFLTLAQFLQGNAFQYSQDFGNSRRGNRLWNTFFFVQDDWHVTRTFTLNVGFREEVAGAVSEINGILSNLDITKTTTPMGGAGTGPLGAFYTGGSYFKTNWNPGPRFGFAWNPRSGKTVIRGGYGISYDFIFLNPITNGRFLPPYMYTFSLPQGQVGVAPNTLDAIYAGTSPFQQQSSSVVGTFGTTIKNFGNVTYIDPNLKNPQVQQYTLTVERQIFSWLFRVGYSGSKGTYLQRTQLQNIITPGLYTIPQSLAQQQQEQAAGVFTAVYNASNPSSTTPSNRIDPRFNRVSVVNSTANSSYNSLQIYAERRFADWYGMTVAYTWSKSIDDASDALGVLANDTPNQQDPFNNRNNRAVSQFDIPQRIAITHDFLSNFKGISNPVARYVVNGWEFSGIFQAQTGVPVNLFAGTVAGVPDGLLIGFNAATYPQRPNQVGPINIPFQPNPGAGSANPNLIPNSGLAQPLIGHLGTLGRNVLRINPLIDADMTFGRVFKLRERLNLRLQAQVYNVFNNTTFSFGSSVNNLSSPSTFGYYSGTDTNTRRIALTGRLNW
ncbi:MAG: TonB-dependent receptor [Bryobacterales bacterium]|nr:TonB-dependent receptor [Bryobacterales bacterium]MBV9401927.1 TonB-dependent receptor [Bryobacterales bacterium]